MYMLTALNVYVYVWLRRIVGKQLYYHISDPDWILREDHTNRSPDILALLTQLSLPSFLG